MGKWSSSWEMVFHVPESGDAGRYFCTGGRSDLVSECTTTTTTTVECEQYALDFDLSENKVVEDNLGGWGTGYNRATNNHVHESANRNTSGALVIRDVTQFNGKGVAMVATVVNTDYQPQIGSPLDMRGNNTNFWNTSVCFNVRAGSTLHLNFSFVETDDYSVPVALPAYYVSIMDIDLWYRAWGQNPGVAQSEEYTFSGYENFITPATKEYTVLDHNGGKKVISTHAGAGCDNQHDPLVSETVVCRGRTINQRNRKLAMLYKASSSFDMVFHVPESGDAGRYFCMGGRSDLVAPCS